MSRAIKLLDWTLSLIAGKGLSSFHKYGRVTNKS